VIIEPRTQVLVGVPVPQVAEPRGHDVHQKRPAIICEQFGRTLQKGLGHRADAGAGDRRPLLPLNRRHNDLGQHPVAHVQAVRHVEINRFVTPDRRGRSRIQPGDLLERHPRKQASLDQQCDDRLVRIRAGLAQPPSDHALGELFRDVSHRALVFLGGIPPPEEIHHATDVRVVLGSDSGPLEYLTDPLKPPVWGTKRVIGTQREHDDPLRGADSEGAIGSPRVDRHRRILRSR